MSYKNGADRSGPSKVDLTLGPPFTRAPGDVTEPASDLVRWAKRLKQVGGRPAGQRGPILDSVSGEVAPPAIGVVRNPADKTYEVARASLFAAGALAIYEDARGRYNRTVDRLNEQWQEYFDGVYVPAGASAGQAEAVQDAVAEKKVALRALQRRAEAAFDKAANKVVSMLDEGPEAAASNPRLKRRLSGALSDLAAGRLGDKSGALRVMTLNVGAGAHNEWGNENGFEPDDTPALAKRILDEEVDVANLQEVFGGDLDELEAELERQSGDEWTLAFSPASTKAHDSLEHGSGPFGNVIAVRAPDDGSVGANGAVLVDAYKRRLTSPSVFGVLGGEGGDGRSMVAVTVEGPDGERVTIGTAQTDYEKEIAPQDQADQLRDFRRYTEQFATESGGDHTILTGDLNHVIDEDMDGTGSLDKNAPYYDVLESWQEDYANAGDSADSSHANGNEIDYIWTSDGLDYDNVDLVPGDHPEVDGDIEHDETLSDHNGIALDIDPTDTGDAQSNDPPADPLPAGPGASSNDDYWWREHDRY